MGASSVAHIVCGTVEAGGKRAVKEDENVVLELERRSGVKAEAAAIGHAGTGRHPWIG